MMQIHVNYHAKLVLISKKRIKYTKQSTVGNTWEDLK